MLEVCEVSFIICRVDIRLKIWQKQHNFALLLNKRYRKYPYYPNRRIANSWGGGDLREMYEMYEVKLVSQSVNQSVSQSLSQLGQSVNRVGMHLNHVTIMVNEIDL